MYLKLTKNVLIREGGTIRYLYSGLDINKLTSSYIVSDIAFVGTTQQITELPDGASEITLEEYNDVVSQPIIEQQSEITELKQAIAELTMMIASPVGGDGR